MNKIYAIHQEFRRANFLTSYFAYIGATTRYKYYYQYLRELAEDIKSNMKGGEK